MIGMPTLEDLQRIFTRNAAIDVCIQQIDAAIKNGDLRARFSAIREIYRLNAADIETGRYDPYCSRLENYFTPIEESAWHGIRYLGLPFYPQYPVGRFFVDFGDPVKRIAIECDGQQWHDPKTDALRDTELRQEFGWRTFRVSGRQCVLPEAHPESVDELLRIVARDLYGRTIAFPTDEERDEALTRNAW